MFKLILILSQIMTLASYARMDVQEFESGSIKAIEIETHSGFLDIVKTETPEKTIVSVTKLKLEQRCQIKTERQSHVLKIKVVREKKKSNDPCEANITLQVPRAVDVEIKHGAGDITVKDLQGKLEFELGTGNVTANGGFHEVEGKLGSGNITVDGMGGEGDFKVGSGNLKLTYNTKTPHGDLEIKTGSGDATVIFPKGTKVQTDFKAGSGTVTNSLGEDKKSGFKIFMKSGAGKLDIQGK